MKNAEDKTLRLMVPVFGLLALAVVLMGFLFYYLANPTSLQPSEAENLPAAAEVYTPPPDDGRVENGLDVATGFIAEGDYKMVKATCTACHSSKLVLQNRATKDGWKDMIRWMQETQKLWDLGENEEKILTYLATHYGPPADAGRRKNLVVEEWYPIGD
ncbi:MAG: hypothetical protein SF052_16530 [Bacteroidia bacterium]|nr:hypothetical protein [Bacteroidia bacterium]